MSEPQPQTQTEPKRNGMMHDANGNLSSKRIVGTLLIVSGGVFLLIVGVVSISQQVADSQTAMDAGRTLIFTGGGLLGAGVAEKLKGGVSK